MVLMHMHLALLLLGRDKLQESESDPANSGLCDGGTLVETKVTGRREQLPR